MGVGRGIVPYEVARFGVDPDEGRAMFDEALEVLLKGLNNETLNYEGKFYNYKDIKFWIKPYQQPHPPIWYASGNLETAPWMAKNGIHTSHIFDTNAVTKKHSTCTKSCGRSTKVTRTGSTTAPKSPSRARPATSTSHPPTPRPSNRPVPPGKPGATTSTTCGTSAIRTS